MQSAPKCEQRARTNELCRVSDIVMTSYGFRNTDQIDAHPNNAAYNVPVTHFPTKCKTHDVSGSTNMLGNSYAAVCKRHGCPKFVIMVAMLPARKCKVISRTEKTGVFTPPGSKFHTALSPSPSSPHTQQTPNNPCATSRGL